MKKAAIILIYITFGIAIATFVGDLIRFVLSLTRHNIFETTLLISIIHSLITIVLTFPILNAIKRATSKEKLIPWAIVTIIFSNLVSGILLLIMSESELNSAYQETPKSFKTNEVTGSTLKEDDTYTKLMKLKSLYEQGLISEEEYKEKREEYIDKF